VSRRLQRLNVQFRTEIADLIQSELRDPRIGEIVSVTRVDVSPDLENASAYVSILGDKETKVSTMQALSAAAPYVRRCLLKRVRIRRIPTLQFVLDESIEEAAHLLDLMRKVGEESG
jgi:ribosome-binding factor A